MASASSSSSSCPPPASYSTSLPIMALKNLIVSKIKMNRVTLIVGDTGCGKSSQVPQFLLAEGMHPILCTQPRRFAVVAIAKMVANARNCEIGDEVGYHIGHSKVAATRQKVVLKDAWQKSIYFQEKQYCPFLPLLSRPIKFLCALVQSGCSLMRTKSDCSGNESPAFSISVELAISKIVFKTAGVLLEEMRDKGIAALRYKVIILDEVHERSVESDLVLACVKQFMLRNHDMRVVLMSATADIDRYRNYFKELGRAERVEVIAIPNSERHIIFQRKVFYLEQVAELLGKQSESLSAMYCSGESPVFAGADIQPQVHQLIHDLVLYIHDNEPNIEKSILIFLPTYNSLEQQWFLLKSLHMSFKVHVLHRSIDTEQALGALKICKSHRKVILATNIAESSVTIPGVAFVIDSCRSLQIFFDQNRKKDAPDLVWVSKSQADQRKGRTGRTCDGQIYRLVTRSFFNNLSEHERPAILRLSLRQQVLMVCCTESKVINNPKVLFQKALDPPDPEVVEDALNLLVHVHALENPVSARGRYEPTFYGRLLGSLALSFDASVLILKFGEIGMLREGILIGILMDLQPLPILHPFGQQTLFAKYLDKYFEVSSDSPLYTSRKEVEFMGNLCAFAFWQRVFKDKHRLERLKQVVNVDEPIASKSLVAKLKEEWCCFHNLVQTSLNHVNEIYEVVLNAVHRFRPKFLVTSNGLPSYYDPYDFKHTCLLPSREIGDINAPSFDNDLLDSAIETRNCLSSPFVASEDFQASSVSDKLAMIVKEMRIQLTEDTSGNQLNQLQHANDLASHIMSDAPLCRFFVNGLCNRGNQCSFSHSLEAKRPVCKFFFSFEGCRNGDSCFFLHDLQRPHDSSFKKPIICLPEDETADADSLTGLLPATTDGCILILDDTNLHFSSYLCRHFDPTRIIVTTSQCDTSISGGLSTGVTVLWGVSHPDQSIINTRKAISIPWREVRCVLWFAKFGVTDENLERQSTLLQRFFELLAIRILADTLYDVQVILTINNVRFAQLQVERLGRECFFFLVGSFPFNELSFGEFPDLSTTNKPMTVSRPTCYIFDLQPPTDILVGDYSSALQRGLYANH